MKPGEEKGSKYSCLIKLPVFTPGSRSYESCRLKIVPRFESESDASAACLSYYFDSVSNPLSWPFIPTDSRPLNQLTLAPRNGKMFYQGQIKEVRY